MAVPFPSMVRVSKGAPWRALHPRQQTPLSSGDRLYRLVHTAVHVEHDNKLCNLQLLVKPFHEVRQPQGSSLAPGGSVAGHG